LLRSASTHRAGLVANTDFAGALASALSARPGEGPLVAAAGPEAWPKVASLSEEVARADRWRGPGIRWLQAALLAAALLAFAADRLRCGRWAWWVACGAPPALFGLAWLVTAEGPSPGAVVFWLVAPALLYSALRRGSI